MLGIVTATDVPPAPHHRQVPMPSRIRALPRNRAGYPIPYFAAEIDGERDFRVGDTDAYAACIRDRVCWVCGQRRTRVDAFVIGPMCAVNRITQDPPCHLACAVYSVRACPFMARPSMVRRERGLPDGSGVAGFPIDRNPGVGCIWVTNKWSTFRPPRGGQHGVLFELDKPVEVTWWAHGRPATRAEAVAAIDSGMPLLERAADADPDPAGARRDLAACRQLVDQFLPAA